MKESYKKTTRTLFNNAPPTHFQVMQLTNYSFLESRRDYLSAHSGAKVHANRIATGGKLNGQGKDLGALGVKARFSSVRNEMNHNRTNLQNYVTHLDSQMETVRQVRSIYDRMSVLAHRSMSPMLSEFSTASTNGDKSLLDTEFQELRKNLDEILKHSINNQRLFGGNAADFSKGIQDRDGTSSLPQWDTKDVGDLSSGVLEINFCPGEKADQIWVMEGDPEKWGIPNISDYFTTARADHNVDLVNKLTTAFEDFGIFTTGTWQTFKGSTSGRTDTFKIDLGACKLEDLATLSNVHPDNTTNGYGQVQFDSNVTAGTLKRRFPTGGGTNTQITVIALNDNVDLRGKTGPNLATYEISAKFNPALPKINLKAPSTGESLPSMSFGALNCKHVDTSANAREALNELDSQLLALNKITATLAAEKNRHLSELEHLRTEETHYEAAGSRISDADIAKEAMSLAKSTLKMSLAEQVMSKSARLKDVLIPLTTEHHRSAVLSSTL